MLWQQFVQRPEHLTNNSTVSLNIVFSLMCPCRILHAPGQRNFCSLPSIHVHLMSLGRLKAREQKLKGQFMDSRSYDAADQLRKSAARSKWMEAQTSTACASFDQDVVPLIRKEQVYACIRKEMGIVFFVLDVVRTTLIFEQVQANTLLT
jgi:hypothetical protein